MELGLNLNAQVEGITPQQQLRDLLQQAHAAADAGFSVISSGQHYLTEPMGMFQPLPLLTAAGREIPEVRLLTSIILAPLENPVRLAEEVATIDNLLDGRLILGMGAGYREVEFAAFGVTEKRERYHSVVRTVVALLERQEVTASGSWGSIEGARLSLEPAQCPRPPVWIAGNNARGVAFAASAGDRWLMNPHAAISVLRKQVEEFHSARPQRERVGQPLMRELVIDESSSLAWEIADRYLTRKYINYVEWGQDSAQPTSDSLARPFEDLVKDRFIVGDPDECIEQIQHISRVLDPSHMILRVQWSGSSHDHAMRAIELCGRHLIGSVAEARS